MAPTLDPGIASHFYFLPPVCALFTYLVFLTPAVLFTILTSFRKPSFSLLSAVHPQRLLTTLEGFFLLSSLPFCLYLSYLFQIITETLNLFLVYFCSIIFIFILFNPSFCPFLLLRKYFKSEGV